MLRIQFIEAMNSCFFQMQYINYEYCYRLSVGISRFYQREKNNNKNYPYQTNFIKFFLNVK